MSGGLRRRERRLVRCRRQGRRRVGRRLRRHRRRVLGRNGRGRGSGLRGGRLCGGKGRLGGRLLQTTGTIVLVRMWRVWGEPPVQIVRACHARSVQAAAWAAICLQQDAEGVDGQVVAPMPQ